jgi:WD40 repeat protein
MIRVLTKTSNGRELIRGHTAPIIDIQFFSQESDIFASGAVDGGVFVWKLISGTEESVLR